MKPIVIFKNVAHEGPGYLGDFLTLKNIPWQIINTDQTDTLPSSILGFSGVVLMGGPMSVNDNLPWIEPLLDLIVEARKANIPLLGHCLGGQLISKAFGAEVTLNPVKEIGWGEVSIVFIGMAKPLAYLKAQHMFWPVDSVKTKLMQ